jgi:methylated-DNA-[protein]-cysteine S-methyltransferase
MSLYYAQLATPLGRLLFTATGEALTGIFFEDQRYAPALPAGAVEGSPLLRDAAAQLSEYFSGARREFSLPLAPSGTEFQRAVWRELARIPFGETRSYGALAARLGAPRAARAVGAANGQNPFTIVLPCHRVLGASGALTGYAGGEHRKRWLLDHERATSGARAEAP